MHYFFTNRHGGYSKSPYDSLNFGLHVNDDPILVNFNRKKLLEMSGAKHLVFMQQVHGIAIKKVEIAKLDSTFTCDGLVCNEKEIALCVMVADCVPLLFYDGCNKAIGVAHAGRKGSYGNISAKMCEKMAKEFGTNAQDLKVKIGPCIHSCCYEVQKKDIKGFESFARKDGDSFYLDLVSLNRHQLLQAGVQNKNIEESNICTCCDKDYFSYRREKNTGRFCGLIRL